MSPSFSLPDYRSLSLEQQVAQLFVVRSSGFLLDTQIRYPAWEPPADRLHGLIEAGVGGVIFLGGSAAELALRTAELEAIAQASHGVPLLLAADVEEGLGQRFAGGTWFAPLMALGAIALENRPEARQLAAALGEAIARESLAVGLNWPLVPVADVNNNPANPVINVRSFGADPEIVSELVAALIEGARRLPVLTAAKHFPGHGDTAVDSHLALPVLPHELTRLETVELPPFARAIAAGVDAVMSAHVLLPVLDGDRPATLSAAILTGLLRDRLGFDGLIVTDALVMGAIAQTYGANEAPILALEAGADILLMPVDPEAAITALCEAVTNGRIGRDRLEASLARLWRAKARLQPRPTPPSAAGLRGQLAQPAARALEEQLVRRSLRSNGLSLAATAAPASRQLAHEDLENLGTLATVAAGATVQPRNLILLDDALTSDVLGQFTPAVALPRQWGYGLAIIDGYTPWDHEGITRAAAAAPTLLQIFARGNPFRGSAGLTESATRWLEALLAAGTLQGLAVYGSPYLLEQFLAVLGDSPYAFSYAQTPLAQAIVLEQLRSGSAP